jgi:hypothetical protein
MSLELPKLSDRDQLLSFCRRIADHIDPKRSRRWHREAYETVFPRCFEDVPQVPSIPVRDVDLYPVSKFFFEVVEKTAFPYRTRLEEWPKAPTIEQDFWMDRFAKKILGSVSDGYEPSAAKKARAEGTLDLRRASWLEQNSWGLVGRSKTKEDDAWSSFPSELVQYVWRIEVDPRVISRTSERFRLSMRNFDIIHRTHVKAIVARRSEIFRERDNRRSMVLRALINEAERKIESARDSVEFAVRNWLMSGECLSEDGRRFDTREK